MSIERSAAPAGIDLVHVQRAGYSLYADGEQAKRQSSNVATSTGVHKHPLSDEMKCINSSWLLRFEAAVVLHCPCGVKAVTPTRDSCSDFEFLCKYF
ncbi:hypothetical protein [Methanosphaerula palustris]|uniref:hypothetical protein n=1 Tax=Methanosphaerula palustris TaxID=475088 RepID=UPI0011D13165|nr:hypothetical protein [Methanosphaerula palustris]